MAKSDERKNNHINVPDNRRETWQIAKCLDIGGILQVVPIMKTFSDLYFSSHTPMEQTCMIKYPKMYIDLWEKGLQPPEKLLQKKAPFAIYLLCLRSGLKGGREHLNFVVGNILVYLWHHSWLISSTCELFENSLWISKQPKKGKNRLFSYLPRCLVIWRNMIAIKQ